MPPQPTNNRLVMLAAEGETTNIVANRLRQHFGDFPLIVEKRVPTSRLLRARARKLGIVKTASQVAFMLTVAQWLKFRARKRIEEIRKLYSFDTRPITSNLVAVESANSDAAIAHLKASDPALVIVNGTRILSRRTLESVGAPFVNMHAGITPAFRGCHGGYWALASGHPHLAGTTIHWIDAGIDTGSVIKQARIAVAPDDSFATYPYLHLACGLPLLVETVSEFLSGKVIKCTLPGAEDLPSRLYHHPTPLVYAKARIFRGVH